jgi:RHS repeat-associated protein
LLGSLSSAHAWYEPSVQRWINRDPLGERGSELALQGASTRRFATGIGELSQGPNLYTVVHNDPINVVDADGRRFLGRRDRSSCSFWDEMKKDPNGCTVNYAAAAAIVCRLAGESPWEQCQRWCLQVTYTPFGEDCCSAASTARFIAKTAARYLACATACYLDAGPPRRPPIPPPL